VCPGLGLPGPGVLPVEDDGLDRAGRRSSGDPLPPRVVRIRIKQQRLVPSHGEHLWCGKGTLGVSLAPREIHDDLHVGAPSEPTDRPFRLTAHGAVTLLLQRTTVRRGNRIPPGSALSGRGSFVSMLTTADAGDGAVEGDDASKSARGWQRSATRPARSRPCYGR
jgi:hypothetical protein